MIDLLARMFCLAVLVSPVWIFTGGVMSSEKSTATHKCAAILKSGKRCSNNALLGSAYCDKHGSVRR